MSLSSYSNAGDDPQYSLMFQEMKFNHSQIVELLSPVFSNDKVEYAFKITPRMDVVGSFDASVHYFPGGRWFVEYSTIGLLPLGGEYDTVELIDRLTKIMGDPRFGDMQLFQSLGIVENWLTKQYEIAYKTVHDIQYYPELLSSQLCAELNRKITYLNNRLQQLQDGDARQSFKHRIYDLKRSRKILQAKCRTMQDIHPVHREHDK
jgi:hypothetical protein